MLPLIAQWSGTSGSWSSGTGCPNFRIRSRCSDARLAACRRCSLCRSLPSTVSADGRESTTAGDLLTASGLLAAGSALDDAAGAYAGGPGAAPLGGLVAACAARGGAA